MSIQEIITTRITECLREVVKRVKTRAPAALTQVSDHVVAGVPLVCASFLESIDSESLDLCVEIRSAEGGTTLAADLVRGGTGQVLSETAIHLPAEGDLEAAVERLRQYVDDQETTIVNELREP